jgi:hypothetical protein
MHTLKIMQRSLGLLALLLVTTSSRAAMAPQPDSGDGWQLLDQQATAAAAQPNTAALANADPLAVVPVVLSGGTETSSRQLTLTITPQDLNLRNALDRWSQTQGWQLAWKIDDDLPLEFNATFTGDFTSVLTQVMRATNHMRTPTRICRHTNNVIRVIARAANCKD